MKWWLIVLLLIAAFGPVLWILPSRRDRQLVSMRQRARLQGLRVELMRLPDLNPKPEDRVSAAGVELKPTLSCVAYRLPFGKSLASAPCWRLQRDIRRDQAPLPGWRWSGTAVRSEAYERAIGRLVRDVPADCLALEADVREVSCYWRERAAAENALSKVDNVAQILEKIKKIQIDTERERVRLQARKAPDSARTEDK